MTRAIRMIVLATIFVFALAGCGDGANAPSPERGQMEMGDDGDRELRRKAEDAVRISESESDVERAHAVVHERSTLIIGIVLDDDASEDEKSRIERNLEQKIQNEVSDIDRVVVTTEDEHIDDIRDVERDMHGGKPFTDLADDTRDLFDRLTTMRR